MQRSTATPAAAPQQQLRWWPEQPARAGQGTASTTTRVAFSPTRVSAANTLAPGVLPAGSTWTKVGLSGCTGLRNGNAFNIDCYPQFRNAITDAGFWGFGWAGAGNSPAFAKVLESYAMVDRVRVPVGIEGGDYVLSWRWDSEMTAQIWTSCSVVTIEG